MLELISLYLSLKDIHTISEEKLNAMTIRQLQSIILNQNIICDPEMESLWKYRNGDPTIKLGNSILFLSQIIFEHYQIKVFVIIDENDYPLNSSLESPFHERILREQQSLLEAGLKGNHNICKVVMTGTLHFEEGSVCPGALILSSTEP